MSAGPLAAMANWLAVPAHVAKKRISGPPVHWSVAARCNAERFTGMGARLDAQRSRRPAATVSAPWSGP